MKYNLPKDEPQQVSETMAEYVMRETNQVPYAERDNVIRDAPCMYSVEDIEKRLLVTSVRAVKGEGCSMADVKEHLARWAQ